MHNPNAQMRNDVSSPRNVAVRPVASPVASPTLDPAALAPYATYLRELLFRQCDASKIGPAALRALDGQLGEEMRRCYSRSALRSTGTFLTSPRLASRLAERLPRRSTSVPPDRVIDPACGGGDLLLAVARQFAISSDLAETLAAWGNAIIGFDINPGLVDIARMRLVLLALSRGAKWRGRDSESLGSFFPNVRVHDAYQPWRLGSSVATVLLNPPFSTTNAPPSCEWATGTVSHAALLVDQCSREVAKGTRLLALLPDVLRTGSRYERWRRHLCELNNVREIRPLGKFDAQTDVEVFMLDVTVGSPTRGSSYWGYRRTPCTTLGDRFEITVGAVVPFRLTARGRWLPYLTVREAVAWRTVDVPRRSIRFAGSTVLPPFVVVRRTSKATYRMRCIATLVVGREPVAVENHLLVAKPKDGTEATCAKLVEALRSPESNDWMNQRIRCRHLTVAALREMPLRAS